MGDVSVPFFGVGVPLSKEFARLVRIPGPKKRLKVFFEVAESISHEKE